MKLEYRKWIKSEKITGRLENPEDFIVKEQLLPKFFRMYKRTDKGIVPLIKGKYVLFLLKKRNMTTFDAIRKIAKELSINEDQFGYAGLKDKNAITYQYMTVKNADLERIKNMGIKDITISDIRYCDNMISTGDLLTNRFNITLHNCKNLKNASQLINELKQRGMPNYFGLQRFGKNRNNHIMGKTIIEGKIEEVKKLCDTALSKNMIKFLLHAYQSWLFNEKLNNYIENHDKPSFHRVHIAGIELDNLRISCSGYDRALFVRIPDIKYKISGEKLILDFELPKGSYATILLGEIMKSDL